MHHRRLILNTNKQQEWVFTYVQMLYQVILSILGTIYNNNNSIYMTSPGNFMRIRPENIKQEFMLMKIHLPTISLQKL